ncbi:MAG: glycosyltransferase family 39 protein, partial [Anaerolineae bacterium]
MPADPLGGQDDQVQIDRSTSLPVLLTLLAIVLLAAVLRFYQIDGQSLWNDEGTSVALAGQSPGAIASAAAADIHPPLYYWLLAGWTQILGTSEVAVRSLSAILGTLLVALTFWLGRRISGPALGLVAALLAAASPFQVYYSQEARMYILAAVLAAAAIAVLVRIVARPSWPAYAALVLTEAAGLYTHYSFAFVVIAINLAYLLWLAAERQRVGAGRSLRVVTWLLSQAAAFLLYLPWLPTALRQVTSWPTRTEPTPIAVALTEAWRWIVFGPTIETATVVIPLLVTALLTLLGLLWLARPSPEKASRSATPGQNGSAPAAPAGTAQARRRWTATLLFLWLALPLASMLAVGLYREAYLKFLLVTTPAFHLLAAIALRSRVPRLRLPNVVLGLAQLLALLLILWPSARALHNYYTDPSYARDDYRAIAGYLEAVGRPGDAIVLNAPGQQEVFRYYYDGGLPVHPLPVERPLDPATTQAALEALAEPGGWVYAVLWATDESDPGRFVESWLDEHTYKATDSWYGNVRLAVYAVPKAAPEVPDVVLDTTLTDADTGDEVTLLGYSLLDERLVAGDIAQITLFWRADHTPSRRYKVFVHILDRANQIVGQRDTEPGGGALLTTLWPPGEAIRDNYGVPIHPATPPGEHRVEVGMYDVETGRRLLTPDGASQVWLEPVSVARPPAPAAPAALGMEEVVNV